jgi:hypothetical protein
MQRFVAYLRLLPTARDGSGRLVFCIDRKRVCKKFFKQAAAIPTKSFDSAIAMVQGHTSNRGVGILCCNENRSKVKKLTSFYASLSLRESRTISFLDVFFQSKGRKEYIETSPNTTGELKECLVIRMRWREVYDSHYVPSAKEKGYDPFPYAKFVEIRKLHRPRYKKHRKVKRKSWNHLECGECVRLQAQIDSAKNPETKEVFQKKLNAHLEYQAQFRHNYEHQIEKVLNHNRETDGAKDIIMQVDGSGADGTKYSPYYPEDIIDGENPAHLNLKTNNTFAKVHGWGRIVFQSYPMLESQGTNLVLEIIFRVCRIVMESNGWKKLRNVYIFFDNAKYNKSHVLIAGLCSLVLLGICRKVKVGYHLVSHTHCDNDGEIGVVGNHLCVLPIQSFDVFEREVKNAFKGRHNTEVVRLVGITDFKTMFNDIDKNPFNINGISQLHGFRIVARPGASSSETGVDVHYTEDYSRGESWFPRPAPILPGVGNFDSIFAHPDGAAVHGKPITCLSVYAVVEKRQRQQWVFVIGYSMGSTYEFTVRCPSLPYALSRDSVVQRMEISCRQELKKTFFNKLDLMRTNIRRMLRNRCDEKKYWPQHKAFLKSLPKRKEDAHAFYYDALAYLKEHFGGHIILPPVRYRLQLPERASDYICPISYSDAPVSGRERLKVLTALGLYNKKKRKRRKKVATSTIVTALANAPTRKSWRYFFVAACRF